jgi:hypothetical protein
MTLHVAVTSDVVDVVEKVRLRAVRCMPDIVRLDEGERGRQVVLQLRRRYAPNEQDALEILLERLLTRPQEVNRESRGRRRLMTCV